METAENLKINSVVNLQLPVDVDVSVSADTVGEQLAPRFVARDRFRTLAATRIS